MSEQGLGVERYAQNIKSEIAYLKSSPDIKKEELFGAKKLQDAGKPRVTGTRLELGYSIEAISSSRSPIKQQLECVIALGGQVLLGIVNSEDDKGNSYRYVSLFTGHPSEERAKFVATLNDGEEITIGRSQLAELIDPELARGVSSEHIRLQADSDDVLTVIDQNSTNGTTVFSPEDTSGPGSYRSMSVHMWSIPTPTVQLQLEQIHHEDEILRKGMLGRFVVS